MRNIIVFIVLLSMSLSGNVDCYATMSVEEENQICKEAVRKYGGWSKIPKNVLNNNDILKRRYEFMMRMKTEALDSEKELLAPTKELIKKDTKEIEKLMDLQERAKYKTEQKIESYRNIIP